MPITHTTSQLLAIPSGPAGTRATLEIMRELIRKYKKTLPIRQLAVSLTRGLRHKDYLKEAARIHRYVRDSIRYIKDIRGVETVQTPLKTIEIGQGDCDDKATLAAALMESIGHPTRLVAIGFRPGKFAHVYVEAQIKGAWVAMETTEPWPLGKRSRGTIKPMMVYT